MRKFAMPSLYLKHRATMRGIFLVGCIALIIGGSYVVQHRVALLPFLTGAHSSLNAYATQVIADCAKESYTPACYDREIPKLMDKGLTMEQGFEVTRIIQKRVGNYYFCHVLGHNLAAKETAKDPKQWTSVIARCPVGMCSNGCLHGAAQERFRNDALTPDQVTAEVPEIATICASGHNRNFTDLEQASCFHSLGHLMMYITAADIRRSTQLCDTIAHEGGKDFTQTCHEGAFMQIYQPLEPEDFTLVKNIAPQTTAQAETFCDSFSGEPRSSCHRESWPLYIKTIEAPQGLQAFCSLVSDPVSVNRCYAAMFFVLPTQFQFDESKMIPLCEGLPEKRKAQCFADTAARFVETDYSLAGRAAGVCKVAEQQGVGDRCFNELLFYSGFNYHQGSEGFNALCNALPDTWKTRCFNGDGKNVQSTANQ